MPVSTECAAALLSFRYPSLSYIPVSHTTTMWLLASKVVYLLLTLCSFILSKRSHFSLSVQWGRAWSPSNYKLQTALQGWWGKVYLNTCNTNNNNNTCAVYKCIQSVGVLFKCVAVPLLIRIELLLPKFLMKG